MRNCETCAAGAVNAERLKVALDLRDLPAEQVGTRTYAVSLARALVKLPQIELTLLVRERAGQRNDWTGGDRRDLG
jgi:hypothetical protein